MTSHDEIQLEIPAYVASRLEGIALRNVEEHLVGCDTCREITATWKEIVPAMREGGEVVFERHPLEKALREYAAGSRGDRAMIERHIAGCASCGLEVSFWRSRQASGSAPAKPVPARPGTLVPAWARSAAAGLLVGLGVAYMTGIGRVADPPPAPPRATVIGRLPQVVLPSSMRGAGVERNVRLTPPDRHLIIAAQIVPPADAAPTDRIRFELQTREQGIVWFSEIDIATLRADVEANEVVSLVVPTGPLVSGPHTFVAGPAGPAGLVETLYRATIVISRNED